MKILIISYFFPPYNIVGSIRIGKFSKYLTKLGNEVKVITVKSPNTWGGKIPDSLPLEIEPSNIIYVNLYDRLIPKLLNKTKSIFKKLNTERIINWLWYFYAFPHASKIIYDWKPDIIFATTPPPVALFLASSISKKYCIPWVADFRDLWSEGHLFNKSNKFPNFIKKFLEMSILKNCSGIITVTEKDYYLMKKKYGNFGIPIELIHNGFDLEDYTKNASPCELITKNLSDSDFLIVYTGSIHKIGNQSPEKLFKAINLLDNETRSKIKVWFFGTDKNLIINEVKKHKMESHVTFFDRIAYNEVINVQKNADLLLLLLWSVENENTIYTTKLFEYMATGKPILAIGGDTVIGNFIESDGLGLFSNDPLEISNFIKNLIQRKNKKSKNEYFYDPRKFSNFSREEQTMKLFDFLKKIISINQSRN
jgi:glycosyltransferase involved in cell wall biosynthesis